MLAQTFSGSSLHQCLQHAVKNEQNHDLLQYYSQRVISLESCSDTCFECRDMSLVAKGVYKTYGEKKNPCHQLDLNPQPLASGLYYEWTDLGTELNCAMQVSVAKMCL